MFKLPQEILRLIYEYDDSYKIKFNVVLQEIYSTVLFNHLSKLDKYISISIISVLKSIARNPKNPKIFFDEICFTKEDIDENITFYEIFIGNMISSTFIKGRKDNFYNDNNYYYKIEVEDELYLYCMV